MKLAVSNIAWSPEQRLEAYALLREYEFTGLEIAPGLFLPQLKDPFAPTVLETQQALSEIRRFGLELVSMQSLLFGVQNAALFGRESERRNFRQGMLRAISLAEKLEIPNLVFGSPTQRIRPEEMSAERAIEIAAEEFQVLGDAAQRAGTIIAVECNPAEYGTNFLTDPFETSSFVDRVGHPAVALNFDVGAIHMAENFDRLDTLLSKSMRFVNHVHVSEPNLEPAPRQRSQARTLLTSLREFDYQRYVSIEMKNANDELATLERGVRDLRLAADGKGG